MSHYTDTHHCPKCKRTTQHNFYDTGHNNPDYICKCMTCGYERDEQHPRYDEQGNILDDNGRKMSGN